MAAIQERLHRDSELRDVRIAVLCAEEYLLRGGLTADVDDETLPALVNREDTQCSDGPVVWRKGTVAMVGKE